MLVYCGACCAPCQRTALWSHYKAARERMRGRHPFCVAALDAGETPVVLHSKTGHVVAVDVWMPQGSPLAPIVNEAIVDMSEDAGFVITLACYSADNTAKLRGAVVRFQDCAGGGPCCPLSVA